VHNAEKRLGNRPQEASDELMDNCVEMGADRGAEPPGAGRAGTSGVSADDAQQEDAVAAEEAFHDWLEAQLSKEADEDRFAYLLFLQEQIKASSSSTTRASTSISWTMNGTTTQTRTSRASKCIAYYRWGNRQRPVFILSIRVWPPAVFTNKIQLSSFNRVTLVQRAFEPCL
jgi:hypothetical protein